MKIVKSVLLASVPFLLLAGCASQAKTASLKPESEYVWYTPTGSNIPIRVRKSDITSRQNTTGDQEAMRDVTRRGLHMDRRGD